MATVVSRAVEISNYITLVYIIMPNLKGKPYIQIEKTEEAEQNEQMQRVKITAGRQRIC